MWRPRILTQQWLSSRRALEHACRLVVLLAKAMAGKPFIKGLIAALRAVGVRRGRRLGRR